MDSRSLPVAFIAVAVGLFGTVDRSFAQPELWEELHILLPSNGAVESRFGCAIGAEGAVGVVGAYGHNNGFGSAYLFDLSRGRQSGELRPSDAAFGDEFGWCVAMSGSTAVVGAHLDDDNGDRSGSAYLFDVQTGQQMRKLTPSDGRDGDQFGFAAAISGERVVIGAPFDDDQGDLSGSAYVFDARTGEQLFKLLHPQGRSDNFFGTAVAIWGDRVIVGTPGDDASGENSGSALVFDSSTGEYLQTLLASDGTGMERFGSSVSIDDLYILVGAPQGRNAVHISGSAYLFDRNTGVQLHKLLADDGWASDDFGSSVSVSGGRAVVGAWRDSDNGHESGSAYVFDPATGSQIVKLLPSDGFDRAQFGVSVAITENWIVSGAFLSDNLGENSGSAYAFQRRTANFLIVSPDPLVGREPATFNVMSAIPNERTWLVYSLDGLGSAYLRQLNVVIDLANPRLAIGPRRTDANGDWQATALMPPVSRATNVWFQAVQFENKTNVVATQVVP